MSTPSPSRNVPCNHCRSDDFRVVFAAGVAQVNRVVRCNRCGLMYANPRRSADLDELDAAPPDAEGAPFAERNPQRFEKEQVQLRDHRRTRAFLARAHPGRGRLLELGSSLGFLLDAFRRDGWDVLGVDPDRAACRHASERLGLRTEGTTLERAALPAGAFDAVVALHVIEHVPDPLGTLREIHRILRPGGHLVLETPRYDSLMFRVLRHRERSVSCDGHIFFFTVGTLRDGYTAAGFELERLEFPPRSLTLDRLAYNLAVMSKSEGVKRAARRLSGLPLAHGLRLTLNARDMQRVYLIKPAPPPAAA